MRNRISQAEISRLVAPRLCFPCIFRPSQCPQHPRQQWYEDSTAGITTIKRLCRRGSRRLRWHRRWCAMCAQGEVGCGRHPSWAAHAGGAPRQPHRGAGVPGAAAVPAVPAAPQHLLRRAVRSFSCHHLGDSVRALASNRPFQKPSEDLSRW